MAMNQAVTDIYARFGNALVFVTAQAKSDKPAEWISFSWLSLILNISKIAQIFSSCQATRVDECVDKIQL